MRQTIFLQVYIASTIGAQNVCRTRTFKLYFFCPFALLLTNFALQSGNGNILTVIKMMAVK